MAPQPQPGTAAPAVDPAQAPQQAASGLRRTDIVRNAGRALAGVEGGGEEALKLMLDGATQEEATMLKVLAAAEKSPDSAYMLAKHLGIQLDQNDLQIINDRAMRQRATQHLQDQILQRRANQPYFRPDKPNNEVFTAYGPDGKPTGSVQHDRTSGRTSPIEGMAPGTYLGKPGTNAGGAAKTFAPNRQVEYQKYLVDSGVAKDAADAFRLTQMAKQDPTRRAALIASLVRSADGNIMDRRPPEQKRAEAQQFVDGLLAGQAPAPGGGGAPPPAPTGAPPAPPAAGPAPGPQPMAPAAPAVDPEDAPNLHESGFELPPELADKAEGTRLEDDDGNAYVIQNGRAVPVTE